MRVDFDKSNVSFGMAIKSTKQAKEFLEKNLSNKSKELLKTLSEKEIYDLPMGGRIVRLAKMIGILRE